MFHGRPLKVMVHNAGQYVGVTSSNADGLTGDKTQIFGDGSLLNDDGSTNFDTMHYYQRMYGEAFIDLCERSLARMKENSGSLIGISSPGVNPALYAAAELYCMPGTGKSLMEYSMRIYAKKAAERRINVNIIVPGVVKTGAWTKLAEKRGLHDADELIEGFLKTVPMNRALVPRDIGDVVAFLCSEGGKFITGVILPVDGGIHLRR
jgi:NAD(P)-dependent dehydrogenase (short-subunit alcohol dehydrogenase family)